MKCPNVDCGTEQSEGKFCIECGTKLEPRKAEFINCAGKDEEGKTCGAAIKSNQKFCLNCGKKVDPNEFLIGICQKCGAQCPVTEKLCKVCIETESTGGKDSVLKTTTHKEPNSLEADIPVVEKSDSEPIKKPTDDQQDQQIAPLLEINPEEQVKNQLDDHRQSTTSTQHHGPQPEAIQIEKRDIVINKQIENDMSKNVALSENPVHIIDDKKQSDVQEQESSTSGPRTDPILPQVSLAGVAEPSLLPPTSIGNDGNSDMRETEVNTASHPDFASRSGWEIVDESKIYETPHGGSPDDGFDSPQKYDAPKNSVNNDSIVPDSAGINQQFNFDEETAAGDVSERSGSSNSDDDGSGTDFDELDYPEQAIDENNKPKDTDANAILQAKRKGQHKNKNNPAGSKERKKLKHGKKSEQQRAKKEQIQQVPAVNANHHIDAPAPEPVSPIKIVSEKVFGMGTNTNEPALESTNVDTGAVQYEQKSTAAFFIENEKKLAQTPALSSTQTTNSESEKESLANKKKMTGSSKQNSETATDKTRKNLTNQPVHQKIQQPKLQRDNARDLVTVIFHALVSKKMLEKGGKVVLIFEDDWNNYTREARKGRDFEKFSEYTFTRDIDRTFFTKGFQYKYCVSLTNDNYIYEDYYIQKTRSKTDNRRLLPPKGFQGQAWHQYDGMVIQAKDTGLFQSMLDYIRSKVKKSFEEHLKLFVSAFAPSCFRMDVNLPSETFQESLQCLDAMIHGLRKVYRYDANIYDNDQEFLQKFSDLLFAAVFDGLKQHEQTKQTLRAMAIAIVCNRLQVTLSYTHWQLVCRSMIPTPDPHKKSCQELAELKTYFKHDAMQKGVLNVIKSTTSYPKDPSWMFCLPVLHFVTDLCHPYDQPEEDLTYAAVSPKWWGIVEVKETVNAFVNDGRKWQLPLTEVLKQMSPLFEMDMYLPRSIIASLYPTELVEIMNNNPFPLEAMLASLLHWCRASNPSNYSYAYCTTDSEGPLEKAVVEWLHMMLIGLNHISQSNMSISRLSMAYKISRDAVEKMHSSNRTFKFFSWTHIFLRCISLHAQQAKTSETVGQEVTQMHQTSIGVVIENVTQWLKRYTSSSWSSKLNSYLKIWNFAFLEQSEDDHVYLKRWHDQLNAVLRTQILDELNRYSYLKKEFVKLYCEEVEIFKKPMQECLTSVACMAIDEGYTVDYHKWSKYEKEKLQSLMSGLFRKHWNSFVASCSQGDQQSVQIVKMALTWPPVQLFLRNKGEGNENQLLHEDCRPNLDIIILICESHWDSLVKGHVEIGMLQTIAAQSGVFADVMQLLRPKEKSIKDLVLKTVKTRMTEFGSFQKQAQLMTVLVNHCNGINVETQAIDTVLKGVTQLYDKPLNKYCKPAVITSESQLVEPELTAFNVPKEVLDVLPRLEVIERSFVFEKMWQLACNTDGQNCSTLEEVVAIIWTSVEERWNAFARSIVVGEIAFEEFEKMFMTFHNLDDLNCELTKLEITKTVAQTRIKQLQEYRQIRSCVHGARVLLKVQRHYDLKGDFKAIEKIAQGMDHHFKMKDFNDSLIETFRNLKGISDEKVRCIDAFLTCDNLVKWLKESMKTSGQKELKVFVDLAMMSAGDEPMNIKKVQCLHSAVLGYSPLIFDLDENCDFVTLVDKCRVVWKEFDANPNLPKQLIDTNHQLAWLKEIKKAHGSVEVTSLMQAEAINSGGIYTVGIISGERGNDDITKRNVIKLTVPEKDGKQQMRNYSFSQLQDLQSRLMLVAGRSVKKDKKEAEVDVEMFTLVFDGITRLGNVFRKLCLSGCVLFNSWKAQFMCNTTRPVCVIISFGEGKDVPKIKGGKSESEGLQDMIPELAKFMENCYDQWLEYIDQKRAQYYHLNFFTIDQLVILQRELVKVGSDSEPSHLIYPLLSAVRKHCTPAELIAAMTSAKEEVDNPVRGTVQTVPTIDAESNTFDTDTALDVKKERFVQELVSAGIDEHIAKKSILHVDANDIEELDVTQALLWCIEENEISTKSSDEINDEVNVNHPLQTYVPIFSGWSDSSSTMASIIENSLTKIHVNSSGVAPLIQGLTDLWESFLGSISSNISDYLSLEHLGIVLKHLAERGTVERKLAKGYTEGEPNLIICPTEEILKVTLSIYMHDKEQPLPMSDEVLVCSSNTTKDEVDIFWRRAIYGDGKRIHCLVNADLLDYDVSEAAEQSLEAHILETNHQENRTYRLFVICGSDNEYRSPFVSSLDKYIRQVPTISQTALRTYVADKLTVPKTNEDSAAVVDFNRSSARIVKSSRAGVGKSLYVTRRSETLTAHLGSKSKHLDIKLVTIPLQEKHINMHDVIQTLIRHTSTPGKATAIIFHIDISHEVQEGIDFLLFNLLILDCLMDKNGYVWRRSTADLYLIETMPIMKITRENQGIQYAHPIFDIMPDVKCRTPQESLSVYAGDENGKPADYQVTDQLFDEKQFKGPVFQRTYQYLQRLDTGGKMNDLDPSRPEGNPQTCLTVLLRRCGVHNPSWSELHHFVWFLNTQLVDFEHNSFVSTAAAEDLPGFATFVLRFLMQMSKDFSTRSLKISEESPGCIPADAIEDGENDEDEAILNRFSLRRTWESSPHPYLFFNSDRFSFTFLGFFIERATGNLKDQQTGELLERSIMAQNLYDALVRNLAPLQENFDALPRDMKITKLCNVMGIEMPLDPDSTYELTTDNVKKIMAIYMRFRCDIPVIIMGETGCGKTRLVKFMCALQCPPGVKVQNMILMKVHGGTTKEDIKRNVHAAEVIANQNVEKYGRHMYTVLFFDEANTTEAIGIIKEIMCDKSICGERLKLCENLKMIAACNPYRKHPDELIKKLEQAGLGYHVDADETTDKLGRIPMRRLVYRVQPLPQSLLPLVWDFGQLNTEVEKLYISQMVKRAIVDERLPQTSGLVEVVSNVLTASQKYMRDQEDECSFVSLRDVERVLTVMAWFYGEADDNRCLYNEMDIKLANQEEDTNKGLDDLTRSLVLALGVCYHACLKTRDAYRKRVANAFSAPCQLQDGADQILQEIDCCQEVFLDNVALDPNIARNTALKENVFMMVVCTELRIPLFLVGKPGSSKSLAKTIVADAMQGNSARFILFKHLKQVQMVSFQCSPLSTPDGIVGTFRQCAQFQKDKDLDTFVSAVVLDEVGLAEDSPRMPLKTLHPLLEDGCQGDETPEAHKKVAFIGISNWALDPAKMNRGILVQREVPDLEELKTSAKGICQTKEEVESFIEPLIGPLSVAYLDIFKKASEEMREFYGLRDFYSLVKMVYGFVAKNKRKPTWLEMLHAIKRNFGGLDLVDPEGCFKQHLGNVMHCNPDPNQEGPDCSAKGLIEACLFDSLKTEGESRYLLLLTDNYGALAIIQQQILSKRSKIRPITIFGSSFRSDQEYTQVCRNINKIKVCMETGNTVVLLNLENLYESLYDALNQYYVYFGGERYVDLGLGTHRVKCPVHKNFRLIVVAEKQTVYKKFPIPLINRLEKHFLSVNTILDERQMLLARRMQNWAKGFASQSLQLHLHYKQSRRMEVGDIFIGYHEDTCSAIILHVCETLAKNRDVQYSDEEILEEGKMLLLWCATPEATIRENQLDRSEREKMNRHYHKAQAHGSAIDYLKHMLFDKKCDQLFAQITCHSKLLASNHEKEISNAVEVLQHVEILSLSSFDTEQQFSNRVQQHFEANFNQTSLLVIQCDSGDVNSNLIACARYCVMDEFEKVREMLVEPTHIVLIVQLPRKAGGCFNGFQCGVWHSVHIDDLYPEDSRLPSINEIQNKALSELFLDIHGHSTMHQEEMGYSVTRIRRTDESFEVESSETIDKDKYTVMKVNQDHVQNTGLEIPDIDKINMVGIIMRCVQPSLAMVKDRERFAQRETKRVDIVLNALGNIDDTNKEDSSNLFTGVLILLGQLLKQKERGSMLAKQWMTKDAAAVENITKSGTFRRSCYDTIVSKVKPVLAGVFAYLDTNSNLDHLTCDSPWKRNVWLAWLHKSDALPLMYADLQSPKRKTELGEMIVPSTGFDGHEFKLRFPFSWVIIQTVEELFKVIVLDENGHERINKCAIGLKSGPSGQILLEMEAMLHVNSDSELDQSLNPSLQDVLEDYIHDFVHTVYNVEQEAELNIVVQTIMFRTADICGTSSETPDLLYHIVCVRFAYEELSRRLVYFRSVNQVWPHCSAKIEEIKKANPEHIMFKEQEFTYSTLCLLVENLNPSPKDLKDRNGQCKWLNKVYQYRPVMETVLHIHGEDPINFGYHSIGSIKRASSMWSRVVVLKMFLENVVMKETEDDIRIKHILPLWVLLGDDIDLKEIKSFNAVEKFLKTCNTAALKESIGADVKCCRCNEVLQSAPISVPCSSRHILCQTCCVEMRAMKEYTCPQCDEEFDIEDDWVPIVDENRKVGNEKLEKYQQRCNTFFLEVVTQLCFSEGEPPSEQVLERLLSYVTCTSKTGQRYTKNMNLFGTGVDPNPVFRSFLLQLMLKSSKEKYVSKYLSKFIEHTRCGEKINNDAMNEMYLLIVHCWEDTQMQYMERDGEVETDHVCQSLEHANTILNDPENISDQLFAIAMSRACLAITAKCMERYARGENVQTMPQDDRKVIQAAQLLCQNNATQWPKIYLVKLLCRRYGIDVYQALSRSEFPLLKWLKIEGTEQELEVVDRYIVCGDVYTSIREEVAKTILGEDVENIEQLLHKMQTSDPHLEIHLQLALHREIACANLRHTLRGPSQGTQRLSTFFKESNTFKDKDRIMGVFSNELKPEFLKMEPGTDLMHQGIQCLLTHFKLSMSCLEDNSILLRPLIALMKGYPIILNMLLPTMPQDDFDDVQAAVLATRGTETPTFYRCPNGHPYVIGNCGRPATVGKCSECGQEIGGTGHKSAPGNIANTQGDTTKTGHILGRAVTGGAIKPERALNPTYCTATRLILHMAMYFCPVQQVQSIIKPDLETDQISGFLLDHIRSNINDLQRALGRSADDVFLLMHIAINTMLQKQDLRVPTSVAELKSKADRKAWENEFSSSILNELFGNVDTYLTEWNNRLATDKRLGADRLMCQIYETENYQDMADNDNLASNPRMWRFRTPITIQHMYQDLESKSHDGSSKRSLLVLQRFMKEDYLLQALRYVPGVLRLQRLLLHKYQKKLDKSEANILKVKDIKKENFSGHDIGKSIQDFACAWEIIRKILEQYGCPTEFGRMFVPKEFCNQSVNDNTPLAVFLPSTSGPGLCSYAMLDFLFRKQNNFLDSYVSVSQRKDMRHQTIKPAAVTSAHLICYDHEHDLMPLVLANCHYSFEMGVGSKIEYDFVGLERQLMDRLLYSKSRIEITAFLEIDLMIYRTEVTNRTVFMRLAERIPQVHVNGAVRTQICEELRKLPDVCRSLDNLDIAISFLKTTGGLCHSQLNIFMVETLQIENAMLSQKARQSCELQHARALWLLLSLQRSKLLIDHRQSTEEVFETLQDNMFEDLEDDVKAKFKEYMKTLSVDKLSVILEVMHEFLLFNVAIRQNPDDEDNVDTSSFSFLDGLREYVAESEPALILDEATLEGFPNKILYKHGAKAWVLAYKTLSRKLGSKRR